MDRSIEVDVHHAPEQVKVWQILQPGQDVDAGVVHEHVDSTELARGALNQ